MGIFLVYLAFLEYISLWEDVGGPEKDRVLCFSGDRMTSLLFTSDPHGQLYVFWHDGYSFRVNSTQVRVLEQTH